MRAMRAGADPMGKQSIAQAVLDAVGGRDNIMKNEVCMTRLRITLNDPQQVNDELLNDIPEVLGTVGRGSNGIEVVFGPRLIEDVNASFSQLVEGKPSETQQTATRVLPVKHKEELQVAIPHDEDYDKLATLLSTVKQNDAQAEEENVPAAESPSKGRQVLVMNGPNINMLGIREPAIYGKSDFAALLSLCQSAAREAGFAKCTCYQSNHEGDLVDQIQDAYGVYDGIVFNPGAYTHTSIALLDALKAVSIPTVEVHISKVDKREKFRQISYVRAACFETITGLGIEGYRKAIFDLAEHLGMARPQ